MVNMHKDQSLLKYQLLIKKILNNLEDLIKKLNTIDNIWWYIHYTPNKLKKCIKSKLDVLKNFYLYLITYGIPMGVNTDIDYNFLYKLFNTDLINLLENYNYDNTINYIFEDNANKIKEMSQIES